MTQRIRVQSLTEQLTNMAAQQQKQGKFSATIARFRAHALDTVYCRVALATTMNPDIIGCVWTGDFDLNTLRVNGEILNPERKSCGFKTIPIRVDEVQETHLTNLQV